MHTRPRNTLHPRRWRGGLLALCVILSGCAGDDTATSATDSDGSTGSSSGTGSTSLNTTTNTSNTTLTTTTTTTTTTTGDTDPTTGGTESTTGETTGPVCPLGAETCPCDAGACDDGLVCEGDVCVTPPPPECGDGVIEGDEECDDGDANGDALACKADCTANVCGDGALFEGVEECDDGNVDATDACTSECKPAACGDGFTQEGVEACDDGNDVDTDACLVGCIAATCGDQIVQEGVEECDDGNDVDTDECPGTCMNAVCGDGFVLEGVEACDDGNDVDDDACKNDCTLPIFTVDVSDFNFGQTITDNGYSGTLASMSCLALDVIEVGSVLDVTVTLAANHNWVGDLTAKLVSPQGTVITLFSRPGLAEGADDGTGCCGDSSDLVAGSPIAFNDGNKEDAELLGSTIPSADDICLTDMLCDYFTNPGAATPGILADLAGEAINGTWRVCMADSAGGITGTFVGAGLSILATP